MGLDAGSRIAQYRLERKIGAGGMGEVYLARDEKLNRLVAIKLLTAADDGAKRRLAREARAAASLDHPGICAVYEVGTDPEAGDFIAMQYIEGETLASRLRLGKMPADEAMGIAAQIAESLVAAHKHGLVHRDLKPQNIIITPQGSARLLDFGLALHVPTTIEAANAITSSRVTDPNMVLGTPSYMSPEQVRNETVDFRSDVFSLGCVIYECLTGQRAFTGNTTAEVLGAILHVDPPSVSSVTPSLGPAYDATCARMMDKTPSERFQSAEEALGAIRALMPSRSLSASTRPVVPARGSRRIVVQITISLAVVVAGFFGWQWYQRGSLPVPPPRAEKWYQDGVEALRDGAFVGARTAFTEAIKEFSGYMQAYSRLAEANAALDDDGAAKAALLEIATLTPSRWPKEERLRFEAAKATSLRQYSGAIAAYRELLDLDQKDASRWLDLGRAQEASSITPRTAALASYQKAAEIDPQYAAAHLRLGVMQIRNGKLQEGLASMDTAIELYRKGQRTEGEAEAQLRKGIAQVDSGSKEAKATLEQVLQLAGNQRYPAQDIRAQFTLARLAGNNGQYDEAEAIARKAVSAATSGPTDLRVLYANGLVDLGTTLLRKQRFEDADAQFVKAIAMAQELFAKRVEMRARTQQASMRLQMEKYAEAKALAEIPYRHFLETEDARPLADAKLILSRALENLEQYVEARKLAEELRQFAETTKDNVALGNAIESLAGQTTKQGDFPAAVRYREQIVELHRNLPSALPRDLTNHAELLIWMGRKADANRVLDEVEKGIAAGTSTFVEREARTAQLRALQAATELRWSDVIRFAVASDAAAAKAALGKVPSRQSQ